MELYRKSASQLAAMLRSKEVSAVEIARETLARIEAAEPAVDAFLSVNAEAALAQAARWTESSRPARPWARWRASLWP